MRLSNPYISSSPEMADVEFFSENVRLSDNAVACKYVYNSDCP